MRQMLLLKDKEGASADEFFQIMKRYAKDNSASCKIRHVKQVSLREISMTDIIFCIRGDTPYMYHLLEVSKKLGKTIVYFLDDALKDMPSDSFRYPKRNKWHINCVKKCDVLLTTNPLIAEDYREYITNKRTVIIHTAVEEIVPYESHDDPIKIVYAASEWHIHNYNKMIAPIICELLANNNKIEIYFVGFEPKGISDERIHFVPKMSLQEYQTFMAKTRFDIGLAPLEKNYFSARKYFNKFIEYTRYGICGIYSDTFPYRFVVKDKKNGIMVSNDPQAWLKSIQQLIDDVSLRSSCVKNAQAYLKDVHSDTVIFNKLKSDIPEIQEKCINNGHYSPREYIYTKIKKIFKYYPFTVMEKMYMVRYSIRKEGLKKAIDRIVNKF